MNTARVVQVDPIKRLQMDRLVAEARGFDLKVEDGNDEKNWGGYLCFKQESLDAFWSAYWSDVPERRPDGETPVDPKVLLVAPTEMLSLQWHERRSEIWRVIDGPVRVVKGNGWGNLKDRDYETGEVIEIPQGQWHRLIGLASWGRIAEIWQHTYPDCPSDENDIFRVQDKYGRADQQADPSTPIEERDKKWEEFLLGIL